MDALRSDLKAANEQIRSHVCPALAVPASNDPAPSTGSGGGSGGGGGGGGNQNQKQNQNQNQSGLADNTEREFRLIHSRFDELRAELTASQKAKLSAELDVIMSDLRAETMRRKRLELWVTCGVGVVAVIIAVIWAGVFGPNK